jgi:heterodisulfide reductase subunit C
MIGSIIFALLFIAAFAFAGKRYMRVRRNILLGKETPITGESGKRWSNVLLIAFGQKKMFRRFLPAVMHLFIYVAFLATQIELVEIIVDGFSGAHRVFSSFLGGIYSFIINSIEILSVLAFVGTVVFLIRRNVLSIDRFNKPEMKGWPTKDANYILLGEIVLIIGIFTMNGADVLLQQIDPDHYPPTGHLVVSSFIGPVMFGSLETSTLIILERVGWWMHILAVFGFLIYLPYSKHLHIMLAFPNTFYATLDPSGKMDNMPEVMNEVKSMLGMSDANSADYGDELPEFGANDITSLKWTNILAAYTCTECGRCTSVCPANITGKKLSPRKVMMDVRDRAEEIGRNLDSKNIEFIKSEKKEEGATLNKDNYDDGKSLFDYITPEEIHACTTCNACVEACPVLISPLDIILQLRRHEILTQSKGPSDWIPMFTSLENNGAVWQMPVEREQWAKDLK